MSKLGQRYRPSSIITVGFGLLFVGLLVLLPIVPRAESGWAFAGPLVVAGIGLGMLVSQLNNFTLSPISEERVSEAAGVNSAGGSFGLSFGLALAGAVMLATLSITFTTMSDNSDVLPPDDKEQVADALDTDAQLVTNSGLDALLADESPEVQDEIIRINTEARPISLQVALVIPILAALLGLVNGFRMRKMPDPVAANSSSESILGG